MRLRRARKRCNSLQIKIFDASKRDMLNHRATVLTCLLSRGSRGSRFTRDEIRAIGASLGQHDLALDFACFYFAICVRPGYQTAIPAVSKFDFLDLTRTIQSSAKETTKTLCGARKQFTEL